MLVRRLWCGIFYRNFCSALHFQYVFQVIWALIRKIFRIACFPSIIAMSFPKPYRFKPLIIIATIYRPVMNPFLICFNAFAPALFTDVLTQHVVRPSNVPSCIRSGQAVFEPVYFQPPLSESRIAQRHSSTLCHRCPAI